MSFQGTRSQRRWYCEDNEDDEVLLAQRSNALSNFAYMYFGLVILCFAAADLIPPKTFSETNLIFTFNKPNSHIADRWFFSAVYGISMVYLGIASFFFHGYPSVSTFFHDQASIFAHFLIINVYNLLLFVPYNSPNKFLAQNVAIITTLILVVVFVQRVLSRSITGNFFRFYYPTVGFMVSTILFNMIWRYFRGTRKLSTFSVKLIFSVFFVIIIAFILQERTIALPCRKNSVFQFHALWHVMTGFGFFLLYLYYRSDHLTLEIDSQDLHAEITGDDKQSQTQVELA